MNSTSFLLLFGSLLSLTACNLYGGIDKPSGDAQHLSAARACLDNGDYDCAQTNYQALSSNENDVKISEEELTTLAQQNIFSISDLVSTLGSSRGNGSSLAQLAGVLAARGKTDGNTRVILQSTWASDGNIQNANLKAFSKFLVSYAMLNEVLASAVTDSNNGLAQGDLVANPSVCVSSFSSNPTSCYTDTTDCGAPAGTALLDTTPSDVSSMDSATNWDTAPTLQKVFESLVAASASIGNLNSNDEGVFKTITELQAAFAVLPNAACKRQALLIALFVNQ
jgi:hypothetical protein